MADNRRLGETFRKHFCAGLKRLHRKGLIAFDPPLLPGVEEPTFDEWVDDLGDAFNVFIEPPPENSQPGDMLKYLTRYLTGGPIADGRLISHEDGEVIFWARSKNKKTGNKPRPFSFSGVEFVRRWSMHILPKGFTKTRSYGGFSCRHRQAYLQRCRQLLRIVEPEEEPPSEPLLEDEPPETERKCPRCQAEMVCVQPQPRPSWRDLFREHATCPPWYQPSLSMLRRSPIRGPDPTASAVACTL